MNFEVTKNLLFLLLPVFLFSPGIIASETSQENMAYVPVEGKTEPPAIGFIIGGEPANDNRWPSMVSLGQRGESLYDGHFCGGTIIDSLWVLTAAHCVRSKLASDIQVATGLSNLNSIPAEIINVSEIIIHPMHNPPSFDYDFALLELSRASSRPKRGIYSGSTRFAGRQGTTIGWGSTVILGQAFPTQLQELNVPIVTNQACGEIVFEPNTILESMICAGDLSGERDTCGGDSGSPLYVTIKGVQVQVGITSFGFGSLCASPTSYSVWARVSSSIDFIAEHVPNARFLNENNIPDRPESDILDLVIPVISVLK